MIFSTEPKKAVHCRGGCSALRERLQCTASFSRKRLQPLPQTFASFASNVCGEKTPFVESLPPCFSAEHKIEVQPKCRLAVSHGAVIKERKCQP